MATFGPRSSFRGSSRGSSRFPPTAGRGGKTAGPYSTTDTTRPVGNSATVTVSLIKDLQPHLSNTVIYSYPLDSLSLTLFLVSNWSRY